MLAECRRSVGTLRLQTETSAFDGDFCFILQLLSLQYIDQHWFWQHILFVQMEMLNVQHREVSSLQALLTLLRYNSIYSGLIGSTTVGKVSTIVVTTADVELL